MTKTLAPILFAGLAGVSAFLIGKGTLSQEPVNEAGRPPVPIKAVSPSLPSPGPVNSTANRAKPAATHPAEDTLALRQLASDETSNPVDLPALSDLLPKKQTSRLAPDADTRTLATPALAAREFTFEGVKLGISITEFRRTHPDTRSGPSDPNLGLVQLVAFSESATAANYCFLDGRLYQITVLYDSMVLSNIGSSTVMERMEKKFGKHHLSHQDGTQTTYFWTFAKVNRIVSLSDYGVTAGLTVVDTDSFTALQERRKKQAKTGFDD